MNNDKKTNLYDTVIKNGYSVKSGVYASVDRNIKMGLDKYGEYSPLADSSILNAPNLASVDAMSDKSPDEDEIAEALFSANTSVKYDSILGYYLDLFAGHVSEGDFRKKASSGGFTTWLLKELLERGLIDGVIHIKKSKKHGVLFEYGVSKTLQEIRDNSKTRYYPAEFSGAINQIRNMPGKYAITGIPSFIMEIRLLAERDSVIKQKIAYTFGLICGHQKSAKYAEAFAWQNGIKPGNLKSIDFRKKVPGEPANKYATEMRGIKDGRDVTIIKKQTELYGSHWGHGFFKTMFSDYTDDAMNETADISLGDAWLEPYVKDSGGSNILIVRNETLLSIINEGIKNKAVKLDRLSVSGVLKSQSGLIHQYRDDLPYRLHKKDMAGSWRPKKRMTASKNIPVLRKIVQNLREEITAQSHINYRKAVELDDWSYFEKSMAPLLRKYKWVYALIQLRQKGPVWLIKKLFA